MEKKFQAYQEVINETLKMRDEEMINKIDNANKTFDTLLNK